MRLNIGGPKGNAFYILGLVSHLEPDKDEVKKIRAEMQSSDYNNLLKVFKKYFPDVELYSTDELSGVDDDLYEIDYTDEL